MECKKLLRFYYNAENLNKALDNLILAGACRQDFLRGAQACAEKILDIIYAKERLGELWAYLDGVIGKICGRGREVLSFYGTTRAGLMSMPDDVRREIKRYAARFTRRLRNLNGYGEALRLLKAYYALT